MAKRKADARERLVRAGIVPRGMSVDEAAAYVGMSTNRFKRLVQEGRYPGPMPGTSGRVWDRKAIDAAIDGAKVQRNDDDIEAALGKIQAAT